jgi:hypothetical protein
MIKQLFPVPDEDEEKNILTTRHQDVHSIQISII